MRLLYSFLALCLSFSLLGQNVILTGIIDGDLSAAGQGGNPKAIELYVNGSVDISGYQLDRTNGDNTFTFPAGSTFTNEFVYVVNTIGVDLFEAAFGTTGDFANLFSSGAIAGNGDDPYQLLNASGTILDQTGGPLITVNNYRDGHRYRVNNTGPDAGWVEANWSGGNNTLDGQPITAYASITGFGTYTTTPPGPAVTVTGNGNLFEQGINGGFTVTLSQMAAADVTVTYSLSGTATLGAAGDYNDPGNGSVVITAGQTTANVVLTPIDDSEGESNETIILTLTGVDDATFTATGNATILMIDDEPVPLTLISAVQGNGNVSPLLGNIVEVSAIVVGDFQGGDGVGLGGFFIMEEDADNDADPATSEGVFILDNNLADVNVGDRVRVRGIVSELSNLTTIDATTSEGVVILQNNNLPLPTAAALDLPATASDYEAIEGMLTVAIDAVSITETFGVGRFGEFVVSEGERLIQFTECNEPNAAQLTTYNAAQSARRLTVDDGRSGQNIFPIVLGNGQVVDANNTLRSGSIITDLTGVIDERFNSYRLQGTSFTVGNQNARPATAPNVNGNITVVGMNVLNYFTTLGGSGRGADNQAEFDRQEAKIVAAICELDADIIGLVEIENDGFGANSTLQTLINAIATGCGKTYELVVNPDSGSDQIQVAFIYKPDVVMQSGTAAALGVPANVFSSNRKPLAQTFSVIEVGNPDLGEQLTVCINHWKSKGSGCGAGDDDTAGAGNCNGTRTAAAVAIRDWLATNPTGTADTDYLIIGDLNAYSQEAPIQTMIDAGYVDVVRASSSGTFPCDGNPSYVFMGEWGSLDHALASATLASQVTSAIPWAVNAPEPTALDYDTEFNNPALFANDFYRFSDHDPVVIGLDLEGVLPVELLTFTGEAAGNDVVLNWTTAMEENSDRFEIEHRTPTADFTTIGQVTAAGNSSVRRDYTFTDANPSAGANDYRLRMIDTDGSVSFSRVVTVAFTTSVVEVTTLGNGQFRFSGAAAGAKYVVTDAAGRTLRAGDVTTEFTQIDGQGLPTGVYFLMIRDRTGQGSSFKLMIR